MCIHQSSFLRTVLEEIFDFISEKKLVTDEVGCYKREKGNGNKYFYSTFQFNIKKIDFTFQTNIQSVKVFWLTLVLVRALLTFIHYLSPMSNGVPFLSVSEASDGLDTNHREPITNHIPFGFHDVLYIALLNLAKMAEWSRFNIYTHRGPVVPAFKIGSQFRVIVFDASNKQLLQVIPHVWLIFTGAAPDSVLMLAKRKFLLTDLFLRQDDLILGVIGLGLCVWGHGAGTGGVHVSCAGT